VLAALYPGVTVGLARVVLQERSRRIQLVGLILAAVAVTAIIAG
jgi:EamA domain-containing membrane protein RarD